MQLVLLTFFIPQRNQDGVAHGMKAGEGGWWGQCMNKYQEMKGLGRSAGKYSSEVNIFTK